VISTCIQASFDTQIAVYSGACGSLVCKALDDDTDGCRLATRLVYDVEHQEMYIVVNGYGTQTGNFNITISVKARALVIPVSWWL